MGKTNPYRPFTPNPDQMAQWPDVSGNDINGLGEPEFRRPRHVYWAQNPNDIPHGTMQRWFYTVDPGIPDFQRARAQRHDIAAMDPGPVAETQTDQSPAEWTAALGQFIEQGLCEKIGVAEMDLSWVYDGYDIKQSRVILTGVQHDYTELKKAPKPQAGAEVMRQYNRAAFVAKTVEAWLHRQGWASEAVTGPMAGALSMVPAALACGFGELGKHGSIIDRDLGASFRLSAILTDAPFASTPSATHGIDEFCQNCRICEDACPPEALFAEKKTVRGTQKWYVDFDKCLPFFNETQGCAICIAVCPWSRPGVGPNLAAKLARRADRLGADSTDA